MKVTLNPSNRTGLEEVRAASVDALLAGLEQAKCEHTVEKGTHHD